VIAIRAAAVIRRSFLTGTCIGAGPSLAMVAAGRFGKEGFSVAPD
jgi:hypothetical protein